ncbi:hypothetical protein K491DRAFT_715196 [Lophiostoma macrostomum CBS 122681]|uniref:Uncharacterized protein n=1 Tax=Lophiostoma macrostomum CBS 122681 TaxID=1314788 RepID=A0A6A6TCI5_9PLEO|nr:hypothetical protein K491DRAFT_715196 [Lophiostoma macrostomum CBS 122681]
MRLTIFLSILVSCTVCLANVVLSERPSYSSCGNIRLVDRKNTYVTMYTNSYEGACKPLRAGSSERYTVNRGCTCYFHTTEDCTDDAVPRSGFGGDTAGDSKTVVAWSCEKIRTQDQAAFDRCIPEAFEKAAAHHKLSELDPSEEEAAKKQAAAKQEAAEQCTQEVLSAKAHG